jgi:sterol desaturase/sphingolipid hydroxylase (fatty acid hydroxylase superfamily)
MLDKIDQLTRSHGELRTGKGLVSGIVALSLAILCLLGVLAFHFPEYLTTPQPRQSYDVALLRKVLYGALVVAGALALFNIVLGRRRWLATAAFALVCLSVALGGHKVPVNDFPDGTPYIGLDWFILDLLGSSLIFIFIEKLFPLRKEQPVFRPAWQTDFQHFIVNHLLIGFILLVVNLLVHRLFGWAVHGELQYWVRGLNFWFALFLIILMADLVQYATHRAYHDGPLRYLIVTPNFHHWHHSQDTEAIDRNYAAHFAFIDHLFGTAVQSPRAWPARYGVLGDYMPDGFWAQLKFPFTWRG